MVVLYGSSGPCTLQTKTKLQRSECQLLQLCFCFESGVEPTTHLCYVRDPVRLQQKIQEKMSSGTRVGGPFGKALKIPVKICELVVPVHLQTL